MADSRVSDECQVELESVRDQTGICDHFTSVIKPEDWEKNEENWMELENVN